MKAMRDEAKRDNHDSCHQAHGLAGALRSRITPQFSGGALPHVTWHFIHDRRVPSQKWTPAG